MTALRCRSISSSRCCKTPPADRPDLGARLRDAADQLCRARLPPERLGPVLAWRKSLGGFERLSRSQQKFELARGLRLCYGLRGVVLPRIVAAGAAADAGEHRSPGGTDDDAPRHRARRSRERLAERGLETVEDLAVVRAAPLRRSARRRAARGGGDRRAGERVTFVARVKRAMVRGRWRRYVEARPRRSIGLRFASPRSAKPRGARRAGRAGRALVQRARRRWRSGSSPAGASCCRAILRERDGELELVNPELLGDPTTRRRARGRTVVPALPRRRRGRAGDRAQGVPCRASRAPGRISTTACRRRRRAASACRRSPRRSRGCTRRPTISRPRTSRRSIAARARGSAGSRSTSCSSSALAVARRRARAARDAAVPCVARRQARRRARERPAVRADRRAEPRDRRDRRRSRRATGR